ncbi:MAG: sn-glycerol-1-phosphate dehydrogenase [Clostridia bacterium]|nr:sn-glycerol-1-phosphate dehydrogenase [Clostridia bacterium]
MIEQYIARTIDCSCGQTHSSRVEIIEIKPNVIEKEMLAFLKDKGYQKLTVVCDRNTYRVAAGKVCRVLEENGIAYKLHQYQEESVLPNEHFIGNLAMGMALDSDLILAVGSGTINDICRYVSAVAGKPYAIVGTAPSMDGYISGGSALIYNNLKLTFETHTPVAVFLDPAILSHAPKDMIASGVGDLLGKINCLTDWRLSKIVNDEWHCGFISDIVETAIDKVVTGSDRIAAGEDEAIADLVEALLLSGVCMDFAGNSRPASGCEHHMSHFWEMRYLLEGREAVFHGTKVGIGTVIALRAYEYVAELNPDFDRIKALPRKSFEEWEQAIRPAFMGAADEIVDLEKKGGKNGAKRLAARLAATEANWEQIRSLAKQTVPSQVVYDILAKLDAPTKPHQIGIEKEMAKEAILYAKEIRDRYTVLQLLWDLGELENFADRIVTEYYA